MKLFFRDTFTTISKKEMVFYTTLFRFLIRYRQTAIGPIWVVMQPVAFIVFLGALFVGLSDFSSSEFIPHLAIGYVLWTLVGGYISRAPGVFKKNEGFILNGNQSLTDATIVDNMELIVHFVHQLPIIIAVYFIFSSPTVTSAGLSLLGLFLLIVNGYQYSLILAILGARYKDVKEAVVPLNSILFLATPIIWMPSVSEAQGVGSMKSSILQVYMNFNPAYHFIDLVRAPLLGNAVSEVSYIFVGLATVLGSIVAAFMYGRLAKTVPHWIN